jgi:tetratricopeptide (TPR) repeat protein
MLDHHLVASLGVALALWFAPGGAYAAEDAIQQDVERIESVVDDIDRRSRMLEQQVAPGRGSLRASQAINRYQDAVYHHLIGEYETAAEEFFAIVTTNALVEAGLHWDAEWYLAESLFLMDAEEIAEGTFERISRNAEHPFRTDAVRRLLEIYASDADPSKFDALYEREILRGGVEPSDVILYSVAKAFVTKGDLAKAKDYFNTLEVGSDYYTRARYFLGALLVDKRDPESLSAATPYFQEIVDTPYATEDQRRVYDLALLALARIFYEAGDFDRATLSYDKVGGDSEFFDDKLHELVWTFIKQGANDKAIVSIDTFLLDFPEHALAAELQLVRGHLHYAEEEYDQALETYELVVDEYTPVSRRFGELARSSEDTTGWFEEVLELDQSDLYAPRGEDELPAYAISMMLADPDFSGALELYRELQQQETAVAVSESLIGELEDALGDPVSEDTVASMRMDALQAQTEALGERITLLEVESVWLEDAGGGLISAELSGFERRRQELLTKQQRLVASVTSGRREVQGAGGAAAAMEDRKAALSDELAAAQERMQTAAAANDTAELMAVAGDIARIESKLRDLESTVQTPEAIVAGVERGLSADIATLELEVAGLWQDYQRLRTPAGIDADMDPLGARIDSVHLLADQVLVRLRAVQTQMGDMGNTELARIRDTFAEEVVNVRGERRDLTNIDEEAGDLAERLVRANFLRLEDLFEESVLGADMGMVNVHWSQWVETGERREQLVAERSDLVRELEQRFAYLRQKLNQ